MYSATMECLALPAAEAFMYASIAGSGWMPCSRSRSSSCCRLSAQVQWLGTLSTGAAGVHRLYKTKLIEVLRAPHVRSHMHKMCNVKG